MRRRNLPLAFGLLALSAACGQIVSGVEEDAGSVTQYEMKYWGHSVYPQWFLLVVDDAPTEAARSLREHLAEDLRGFFDVLDAADCGMIADPGMYRPIDLRLIVVGASGTLEPRFRDSDDLHALGIDAAPDLLEAFETAGGEAIVATETAEVLPFVGAAELAHYLNLFAGTEEPRSAEEADLAADVATPAWAWLALATTRPDESPEELNLTWQDDTSVDLLDWPEDSCPTDAEHASLPSLDPLRVRVLPSYCSEDAAVFARHGVADCTPKCMLRPPAVDSSGQVSCRVYGEFPPDVDCEEKPGWTFLESSTSEIAGAEPWPVNLCELRQAEGEALDACINDFACEGCEPSFCFRRPFTAEDQTDPAHRRPVSAVDSTFCEVHGGAVNGERIRLVHGADQVDGFIRVVCQQ